MAGKIGLTFAPGKKAFSKYTGGRWERDLDADLHRLKSEFACDVLVSLIEAHEFAQYEIEGLFPKARALGIEVVHFPIRDVSTPKVGASVQALVQDTLASAAAGRRVVIHCIGGLGRTGTVAGCALAEKGIPPSDAFAILRRLRGPNCPETVRQRAFVENYWQARRVA